MRLLLFIILLSASAISNNALAQSHYKEINTDNLSEVLDLNSGKKRVLLVYASWCPHCQVIYPELTKIEKEFPKSIKAISMNKDQNRLKRFLNKFPDSTIEPIVWDTEYHMGASLNELGIEFSGYIPFIALINANGDVTQQGHVTTEEIRNFLQ